MSLSKLYPAVRPSMELTFAKTRVLDPRITFGRASPATYYDGVTTALAEQNLFLQSQTLDITWQAFQASVTANTTTAPDGTTTADTITATNITNPLIFQARPFSTAGTMSCYIKQGTSNFAYLYVDNPSLVGAYFNINTGVVGSFSSPFTAVSITAAGNGWYRCVASFSGVSGTNIGLGPCDANGSPACTIGRTIFAWGAQVEQRSTATSYTLTTTAIVTNYIPVLLTAPAETARFDANPVTGESLGLMKESQSTNLVLYSADFGNVAWSKNNTSVTTNTIVAPDGTITGDAIVENTAVSAYHSVAQSIVKAASAITYTYTVYAKSSNRSIGLRLSETSPGTSGAVVAYNLATGVIEAAAGTYGTTFTNASSTITAVGNGWYRVSLTVTSGPETSLQMQIYMQSGGTSVYTGNGFSGIFVWGAQLEAATNASSYIPTTATEVIRLRDDISMTGSNFTSWFNNAEGTLLLDIIRPNTEPSNRFSAALFTSTTEYLGLDYGLNPITAGVGYWRSGGTITTLAAPVVNMTGGGKYVLTYTANDLTITAQGASVASAVPPTPIPTIGQLNLGAQTGATFERTLIYFRKVAYYPTRLTNAQLQALTQA